MLLTIYPIISSQETPALCGKVSNFPALHQVIQSHQWVLKKTPTVYILSAHCNAKLTVYFQGNTNKRVFFIPVSEKSAQCTYVVTEFVSYPINTNKRIYIIFYLLHNFRHFLRTFCHIGSNILTTF